MLLWDGKLQDVVFSGYSGKHTDDAKDEIRCDHDDQADNRVGERAAGLFEFLGVPAGEKETKSGNDEHDKKGDHRKLDDDAHDVSE